MAKKPSKPQFSLVPEFSWWRSADSRRLFCVIETWGKTVDNRYQITEVSLVEAGIVDKKRILYKQFSEQVLAGKLVQVREVDISLLIKHSI